MLRRLGALCLVAALLTAGCIGSVRAGTAKEHRDTADERAERFAGPGAELVGVAAFETNETTREAEDEPGEANESDDAYEAARQPDDEFGDGEAPAWVYTYQTSNRTYRVTVAEDGTVIANETDDVDDDRHPIEDWQVTSEEAAETVAENNETWTSEGRGFGFYTLARENATGDPIWTLGQLTGDAVLVARVNATTGEYLGAHAFSFDFGFDFDFDFSMGPIWSERGGEEEPDEPEREGGGFSGTVSATESTAEHAFEVEQADHPELGTALRLEDPAAGAVNATVQGPDGAQVELAADPNAPTDSAALEDPPAGEYTVTVQLSQGASQDYAFAWCAEGEESGDEEVEAACESVDGASEGAAAPVPLLR